PAPLGLPPPRTSPKRPTHTQATRKAREIQKTMKTEEKVKDTVPSNSNIPLNK
ncbi:uncharacterized protein H6S33_007034, partial [Morchella sextelata]|uniref:uncharacterized protein n=1 Tax=Morchella sextelata TaxID=1174677 RepID=UPI001D051DBE